MKIIITPADDKHDSDNVRWEIDGEEKGFGYKAKDTGKIGLIRCPKCDKENYAPNVATGFCTWCGFNANG